MSQRAEKLLAFINHFILYTLVIRDLLIGLVLLIVLGAVAISRLESIGLSEAIYFAFITGLTIGYGDIAPETAGGRIVSVGIGLIGMIFTGITVAVATRALADTASQYREEEKRAE